MKHAYLLCGALGMLALAGCDGNPSEPASVPVTQNEGALAPVTSSFTDKALGLRLAVPTGMKLRHDFKRSYLDNGAWKTYAAPDSQGTPLAALVLDGSNHITAAELRLGTSADAAALTSCTEAPSSAQPGSAAEANLGGVPFQHFRASDAAMSHYMEVESYRAVRDGHCIAIDLLITGTNPSVYPTPPTPPFTRAEAWQQLHQALSGLTFTP